MSRDKVEEKNRRRSVAAAMALIAVCFAGSTLLTPLYVLYQARFGFSPVMLTIIYAAYVIGNAAALLFLGRLSDRVGRRPVAFGAVALCTAATLLFLAANGSSWLFAGRVVSGLAVGIGSGTGAAWLADVHAEHKARATILAAEANLFGIAAAPLVAGSLAALMPQPLTLPFIVYAAALALAAIAIGRSSETVSPSPLARDVFRPRIALPASSRKAFIAPAVSGFVVFAFVGFYAALLPSLLRESMDMTNPAIGGGILAEMFVVAMLVMPATRRIANRSAMLAALVMVMPGLALVVAAQMSHSLGLLIVATACGGATLALGYRGSLEVVNAIAPPDHRAGIVSAYFLACFTGNAIPVICVGVATMEFGAARASAGFAVVMALIALVGLAAGLVYAPGIDRSGARPLRAGLRE